MKESKKLNRKDVFLKILLVLLGIGLTIILVSFGSSILRKKKNNGKSFQKIILSSELGEISGLQYVDSGTLCAIQDEKGKIYFIQIETGKIDSSIKFHKDGDYEGIAKFKEVFYILKSNGSIYKLKGSNKVKSSDFKDNNGMEFEGLCADEKGNRLLVACKWNNEGKKHIWIYAITIEKFEYNKKAAYKISRKSAGVSEDFKPSGISMHKDKIYVISSVSGELLVLAYDGKVEKVVQLDKSIFRQPEGITFSPAGKLYISNEKRDKQPTLLIFENIESLIE